MALYLFGGGERLPEGTNRSLADIRNNLTDGHAYLRSLAVDQVIRWLEEGARSWAHHKSHEIHYLRQWLSAPSLRAKADTALRGSRFALDGFVDLPGGRFACFPRGVVCHWLAGNVPTLGLLSVVQALLTKNCSIAKVAKGDIDLLPSLLASLAECHTEVDGKRLLSSIAVVSVERENRREQEELSSMADARIAWGGMEAVDTVANLPSPHRCEDLLFGPRTSFAVVGREMVSQRVARGAALDASLLEQRGCNSPHTLFVEEGGGASPLLFAQWVAEGMEEMRERFPKRPVSAGETGPLLSLRAEYEIRGEAFYPSGLDWSVLYSEEDVGLADPAYHRTLFVRPIADVSEVLPYCSAITQSVGVALPEERRATAVYSLMSRGVDRCPQVGEMTHYEVPWDGLFLMDRLVRWCRY